MVFKAAFTPCFFFLSSLHSFWSFNGDNSAALLVAEQIELNSKKKCKTFWPTLRGFRQEVSMAKLLMSEAGTGINYIPVSCSGFDEEDGFCGRKQLENSILVTSARPSYLCSSVVYTTLFICILISTVIYTFL